MCSISVLEAGKRLVRWSAGLEKPEEQKEVNDNGLLLFDSWLTCLRTCWGLQSLSR